MMLGRRAEIPEDGLVVLGQQGKPADLILGPGADRRGRQIPDIVHIEAKQCAHIRLFQECLRPIQTFPAQPVEIDALLPVNSHCSMMSNRHKPSSSLLMP
jgi:hypothetical protein